MATFADIEASITNLNTEVAGAVATIQSGAITAAQGDTIKAAIDSAAATLAAAIPAPPAPAA